MGVIPKSGWMVSLRAHARSPSLQLTFTRLFLGAALWELPGHGHGGEARRLWTILLGICLAWALAGSPLVVKFLPQIASTTSFVLACMCLVPLSAGLLGTTDSPLLGDGLQLLAQATNPNEAGGLMAAVCPLAMGCAFALQG